MHILKHRRHETNLADDRLDLFLERRLSLNGLDAEPSVRQLLYHTVTFLEIKQLWVRVDEKGSFNLATLTLPRWGPNRFNIIFHTMIFFLCHFWPGAVYAATVKSWFHCITGLLSSHHDPKPVSPSFIYLFIYFFDRVICFLFWSSMVPTQKCSAQRKKLMNLSFPLKGGSWASSVCTLSGAAAVSEFHTVTVGRLFTDGERTACFFICQPVYSRPPLSITQSFRKPPRHCGLCCSISTMWCLDS